MYDDGVSEEVTGRLLGRLFPHRDDHLLATNVYCPTGPGLTDRGLSRKHIMAAIDASLTRLGTDHVDLHQIHRWDDETPIEETTEVVSMTQPVGRTRPGPTLTGRASLTTAR
jgi:aryl-alcohol dehydrogenase-like predicted oxidoreductase